MLVSSPLSLPKCPKEVHKKRRGQRVECLACDACMQSGQHLSGCHLFNVLFDLCRGVRWRDRENYQEEVRGALQRSQSSTPKTPWRAHYAEHHPQQTITSTPITDASILATQSSLVNRRIRDPKFMRDTMIGVQV
eukprot:scpid109386/ scgid24601/ 